MKRIISIALSLLFLLGLPLLAYAEDVTTCGVTADSLQTFSGSTVTVPVRITENRGFTNFAISLEYDPEKLELISINTGNGDAPYLCGTTVSVNTDWKNAEGSSCGYIVSASSELTVGDGILFTATFRVSDTLEGETEITPKVHYIRNNTAVFSVFEEITAAVTGSRITVVLQGDVNGDAVVEYDDVMLVYKASQGEENLTEQQLLLADINGDQVIDSRDVEAIYSIYTGG